MNPFRLLLLLLLAFGGLLPLGAQIQGELAFAGTTNGEPVFRQTVILRPGWNAFHLRVDPLVDGISAALTDVPLRSLWTHKAKVGSTEFVEDPSEPVWNRSRWLVHLPATNAATAHSTLFNLRGNRGYLADLSGSLTFTLSITGRIRLRSETWSPDAYTFTGFPVVPGGTVTFASWFAGSTAHHDAAGALNPIYRMSGTGTWTPVGSGDLVEPGVAYWVKTRGASDFTAPVEVAGETLANGLEFGSEVQTRQLAFRNRGAGAATVTVQTHGSGLPLSVRNLDAVAGVTSTGLGGTTTFDLSPAGTSTTEFEIRRPEITNSVAAGALRITDGGSVVWWIPVAATRDGVGGVPATPQQEAMGHAGLWVGEITVDQVAAVHSGPLTTVTTTNGAGVVSSRLERSSGSTNTLPTAAAFPLRLLLHVDATGTTRLLREVTQMFRPPTTTNDASGDPQLATAAETVLLTDPSRLGEFTGIQSKDNTLVGRRLSSAGFDFPVTTAGNHLALAGWFARTNTLTGSITLDPDFPTHPFRHRFHPDHDNLDARFTSYREESPTVVRTFALRFDTAGTGADTTRFGYDLMAGTYRETLTGLHRSPLVTSGTFRIRRIAANDRLDP
jgi:hypothetical protein